MEKVPDTFFPQSIVAGLAAVAGFVAFGVVTPESMVGVVLVSGATLGMGQIFARETSRL